MRALGRGLAICAAVLVPGTAAAHEVIPGVTGFPSLVLHPLALPDHVLAPVASGLVAGHAKLRLLARLLPVLVLSMLAGHLLCLLAMNPPPIVLSYMWPAPLALVLVSGGLLC